MFNKLFRDGYQKEFWIPAAFVSLVRSRSKGLVLELLDWCLNLSRIGQLICLLVLADMAWILLRFMLRPRRPHFVRSSDNIRPGPVVAPLSVNTHPKQVHIVGRTSLSIFIGLGTSTFTLTPDPSGARISELSVLGEFHIPAISVRKTNDRCRFWFGPCYTSYACRRKTECQLNRARSGIGEGNERKAVGSFGSWT